MFRYKVDGIIVFYNKINKYLEGLLELADALELRNI